MNSDVSQTEDPVSVALIQEINAVGAVGDIGVAGGAALGVVAHVHHQAVAGDDADLARLGVIGRVAVAGVPGPAVIGVEDQLIGHKKGDSFTIDIKFPSDYEETSLAGQTAQFDVKINRVYSSMTPDLAVSGVVDGSKVLQYPKKMEDEWKDSFLTQFRLYSTDSTSDASALLKENGYDEAGFMDLIHTSLKQDLVYQAILDREGITKDSDEYKKMTETVLKGLSFSSASDAAASGVTEQELRLNTEEKLVESIVVRYEKK